MSTNHNQVAMIGIVTSATLKLTTTAAKRSRKMFMFGALCYFRLGIHIIIDLKTIGNALNISQSQQKCPCGFVRTEILESNRLLARIAMTFIANATKFRPLVVIVDYISMLDGSKVCLKSHDGTHGIDVLRNQCNRIVTHDTLLCQLIVYEAFFYGRNLVWDVHCSSCCWQYEPTNLAFSCVT